MKINITPFFNFLTRYSRKSRLKILLGVLGIIVLSVILAVVSILLEVPFLFGIFAQCVIFGILVTPFLLLALIPKQRVEKSEEMPNIDKVVSSIKSEYKKNQKNSRQATPKERLFWGVFCFYSLGYVFLWGAWL